MVYAKPEKSKLSLSSFQLILQNRSVDEVKTAA